MFFKRSAILHLKRPLCVFEQRTMIMLGSLESAYDLLLL